MSHSTAEKELQASLETMDWLTQYQEELINDSVSMESCGDKVDYLHVRRLRELESRVSMEAMSFQDVKDVFSAMGRASMAFGHGFMKFLDAVHKLIDTTHLVRLDQTRQALKKISPEEAKVDKGSMERARLASALAVGGEISPDLGRQAKTLAEFSRRTCSDALPNQAEMLRRVGQQLEAKRWMGNDAFLSEVTEIAKILGTYKLPMARFSNDDLQHLFPGNRSIFTTIKARRPRHEPSHSNAANRRVVEAVVQTTVGICKDPQSVRGRANEALLPVLTPAEGLGLLEAAEQLLKEAVRVKNLAKNYAQDKVPSTMSLMISGFFHGTKRVFDDFWTSQDDGFDVIEGTYQGGNTVRHKPGTKNMMGGVSDKVDMLSFESEADDDERSQQMAGWVSRYLKLSLIDHQATSRSLILLLVGVASSYLDYAEESLNYYR